MLVPNVFNVKASLSVQHYICSINIRHICCAAKLKLPEKAAFLRKKAVSQGLRRFGEDNRTRTYDPLHVKQVLYQLSYTLVTTL